MEAYEEKRKRYQKEIENICGEKNNNDKLKEWYMSSVNRKRGN